MTEKELMSLSSKIGDISKNFENQAWSSGSKLLRENFDIASINAPKHYNETIKDLEEVLRQCRLLFLYSIFNIVCKEEDKVYIFDTPYQASMTYDAIVKKENSFYLRDEDGDYREMFSSEKFVKFVDDLYWEVYE